MGTNLTLTNGVQGQRPGKFEISVPLDSRKLIFLSFVDANTGAWILILLYCQ